MKSASIILFFICFVVTGCSENESAKKEDGTNTTNSASTAENSSNENNSTPSPAYTGEKLTISDFNSFLGIKYGMTQSEITKVLGDPTEFEKSRDGSRTYNWYRTSENSEIAVIVNSENDKVETVGITFGDLQTTYLQQSYDKTSEQFGINLADRELFGADESRITARFGEPVERVKKNR